MNITATVLLAFGMSMDAFAASIGKGATLHKPKFSEALRTGLIFGAVETLTPLIGWGMGMLASRFVLEWNHWIAFVLLIFLGGRMIIEGFRGADDEDEEPRRRHGFWLLVTTAIATSLDAMAVGVGLAFLQVNIIARLKRIHTSDQWIRSDSCYVNSCRTFLTVLNFELNVLTFSQSFETITLDSGEVYEHIFAAISRSNEAKTFRLVEPLNLTFNLCHLKNSLDCFLRPQA